MNNRFLGAALLGLSLLVPAQASIITINFDGPGMTNFVQVNNQYPSVTFSSNGGDVVMINAQNPPYQGSVPNLICSGSPGGGVIPAVIDCTHDIILTFTDPVDNLSFGAYGNQNSVGSTFTLVDIFFAAAPAITNLPLTVSHTDKCASPIVDGAVDPVSLSYTGITQIVLHNNTDPAGTAYDDFTFSTQATTHNPEPSTLLLTGMCGIFWTGRRFLARKNRKNS